MGKDFLSITDLNAEEIWQVLLLAKKLKAELKVKGSHKPILSGKTLVTIFEKPSLRTRLSFEVGMGQLGGNTVELTADEIGFGQRESIADIGKVVACMGDMLVARTYKHEDLKILSSNLKVPVINGLTNLEHPCQVLADFMTIWEAKDSLNGLTIAFVGDGENNVTHSLALGAAMLGMTFKCAAPAGFWMRPSIVSQAKTLNNNAQIRETNSPEEAVLDADVIITDTWVSMGDEKEKKQRLKVFKDYQVNCNLMKLAKKDAIFLHCLPAYRGKEVTEEVLDGPQSKVLQEAENRLHVQKALMLKLLNINY